MKFKEEKEDKDYTVFTKLIQIEEDWISLIEAGMSYFYINGNVNACEFLKHLHSNITTCKLSTSNFMYITFGKLPERKIYEVKLSDFTDDVKIFETLASIEEEYVDELEKIISIVSDTKQWSTYQYLLDKLGKVDHICCRAVNCIKSKNDLRGLLCAQHFLEN